MKKILVLLTGTLLLITRMYAQTETFDIATYIAPEGWQRSNSNGTILLQDSKTNNGLTSFCQIYLYPSQKSSGTPAKDFSNSWNELVAKPANIRAKPKTQTEKTTDGWTIVSGSMNITLQGVTFTCMLLTATGFGKSMTIMINLAGQEYTATIHSFLENFNLNANGTASNNKPETQTSATVSTGSVDQYNFIAPQNWTTQKGNGFIAMKQPLSSTGQGCVLTIFSPQSSTGNLENDVKKIFGQMYPGWNFYYSDQRHDDLMKGHTKKGFEYCMMEAQMMRTRPGGEQWDYETGAALVVNMGTQIAVVTLRHEPIGLYCECRKRYNYFGRFLNSLSIKNTTAPSISSENDQKRIVGSWMVSGGMTIGEYIFAANGHYQYIGSFGSYARVSPEMIESRTSVFKGDGTYKLSGDQLIMKKPGQAAPETYSFRFEKINQGSTGWKDRIYLLNEKPVDGGQPYEACYENRPVDK